MPISRSPAHRQAAVFCIAVVVAVTVVATVGSARPSEPSRLDAPRWAAAMRPAEARSVLATLEVVDPAPEVAYDRVRDFGPAWADVDHNGCDTRNDILRRDLASVTFRPATSDCIVVSGEMVDPYTAEAIRFSRSEAAAVQIDHVVPLHAAWILGAWRWPPEQRLAFANDPRNLVAVDGPTNRHKSDALADHWLPPNPGIHCVYAVNTVAVHAAYALPVTHAERRALGTALEPCR